MRLPLFLALALLLPGSWAPLAFATPAGYYRSDAIGLALEPVAGFSRSEPYLLWVRRDGALETRTLYKEGGELRRWELSPGLERVFEKGTLAEERSFDGAGRIAAEKTFVAGKLDQEARYRYGVSGLAAVETYDADGTLAARESYELGPGGELRRVRREMPGGTVAEELAVVSSNGRLFEERLAGAGRRLVSRFGRDGRIASHENWRGRDLVETLEMAYAGKFPLSTDRTAAGTRTMTLFDEQGREASRRVTRGGKLVEDWSFRYDAAGNRLQAVRIDDRGTEQWSYVYDAAGTLQREEHRTRGLLQKVVRHLEGGRVEELYRAGLPFLVVTYRGGVKVREEFLEGGQVVRSRDFEAGP